MVRRVALRDRNISSRAIEREMARYCWLSEVDQVDRIANAVR